MLAYTRAKSPAPVRSCCVFLRRVRWPRMHRRRRRNARYRCSYDDGHSRGCSWSGRRTRRTAPSTIASAPSPLGRHRAKNQPRDGTGTGHSAKPLRLTSARRAALDHHEEEAERHGVMKFVWALATTAMFFLAACSGSPRPAGKPPSGPPPEYEPPRSFELPKPAGEEAPAPSAPEAPAPAEQQPGSATP